MRQSRRRNENCSKIESQWCKVWTIKIAGPAGTGIKSVGNLLSQILNQNGYFLKDYSEYPSLVREVITLTKFLFN